jgi:hypothetical protein
VHQDLERICEGIPEPELLLPNDDPRKQAIVAETFSSITISPAGIIDYALRAH